MLLGYNAELTSFADTDTLDGSKLQAVTHFGASTERTARAAPRLFGSDHIRALADAVACAWTRAYVRWRTDIGHAAI